MKITRTARFKKAWQELTEEEKELGWKALSNWQDKGSNENQSDSQIQESLAGVD